MGTLEGWQLYQAQDALVKRIHFTISAAAWPDRLYSRFLLGCAARKAGVCSLFGDLRCRRNYDFGLALIQLNLAANCDCVISQRPQELFSCLRNVLRRHETSKDLLGVVAAKVQKCVALLGDAYLLDKAANTDIRSDVLFCLLWQNRCRSRACPRMEESMLFAGQCTIPPREGGPPFPRPLRWTRARYTSVANSFPSLSPELHLGSN